MNILASVIHFSEIVTRLQDLRYFEVSISFFLSDKMED